MQPSEHNVRFSDMDDTARRTLFKSFNLKHGKIYSAEEESYRFEVFVQNLMIADKHNDIEKSNGGTAIHGITKFSDMSFDEFVTSRLGADISRAISTDRPRAVPISKYAGIGPRIRPQLPMTSMNWAGLLTTPIKDQGDCGGCWAFCVVEQMESDALRLKVPGVTPSTRLSPQQLLSCCNAARGWVNETGCDGGWFDSAYSYVVKVGGLVREVQYPYHSYEGGDVGECRMTRALASSEAVLTLTKSPVTGFYETGFETEDDMARFVLESGPVYAALDATSFLSYESGVVSSCGDDYDTNHAVQVVGVNVPEKYWIVRNSWGVDWGLGGYAHVRFGSNMCGIADWAHYLHPVAASGPGTAAAGSQTLPTHTDTSSASDVADADADTDADTDTVDADVGVVIAADAPSEMSPETLPLTDSDST